MDDEILAYASYELKPFKISPSLTLEKYTGVS
jgi:hypothetical protein